MLKPEFMLAVLAKTPDDVVFKPEEDGMTPLAIALENAEYVESKVTLAVLGRTPDHILSEPGKHGWTPLMIALAYTEYVEPKVNNGP